MFSWQCRLKATVENGGPNFLAMDDSMKEVEIDADSLQ